jgi:hypothetical protein
VLFTGRLRLLTGTNGRKAEDSGVPAVGTGGRPQPIRALHVTRIFKKRSTFSSILCRLLSSGMAFSVFVIERYIGVLKAIVGLISNINKDLSNRASTLS